MDAKDLDRFLKSKSFEDYFSSSSNRQENLSKTQKVKQKTIKNTAKIFKAKKYEKHTNKAKTVRNITDFFYLHQIDLNHFTKAQNPIVNDINPKKIKVDLFPIISFFVLLYFFIVFGCIIMISIIHVGLFGDSIFMYLLKIAFGIATFLYVVTAIIIILCIRSSAKKCAKKALREGGFELNHLIPVIIYFIFVFIVLCICSIIALKSVAGILDGFNDSYAVAGFLPVFFVYLIFSMITIFIIRKTAIDTCARTK